MRALAAVLAAVLILLLAGTSFAGGGPSETVVLVNENSADSVRVAEHYIAARDIPPTQVCRVSCSEKLSAEMPDFVDDVVDPLRRFLYLNDLEERCRFIVLTQGMPIRAKAGGRWVSTAAAIELLDTHITGQAQQRLPRIPGAVFPIDAPRDDGSTRIYMVTALLSSTADEAIALIDRSVESDGTRPKKAHFVFQDARGNARTRNDSYDAAGKQLADIAKMGFTWEHVEAGKDVVTGRKRIMGYMSGGSYSRLGIAEVADNEYLPGAICDMLQSFGAVPQNFAPGAKTTQFPVTHMVRAGVTGVHGAVAEPYTIAFPQSDLFTPYAKGWTLAETFHSKQPWRYWMNLVLGDPLCAPFAERPAPTLEPPGGGSAWSGTVTLNAKAPGAVSLRVFVDGALVHTEADESAAFDLDTTTYANGEHHVLVEAIGTDEAQSCGWHASTHEFGNDAPGDVLTFRREDGWLEPPVFTVEGPESAVAGSLTELTVTATLDGKPLTDWDGRVELRTADPPVRWARADFVDGKATLATAPMSSGELDFVVTSPTVASTATKRVTVTHGELHHATTPLSRFPLGQAMDMPVRLEDRHGNLVTNYDGTVSVSTPDDAHARFPESAPFAGGVAVLRDATFARAARANLVFVLDSGRRVSAPGEGVEVVPAALRSVLVGTAAHGDDAAALWKGDPAAGVHRHGGVSDGRLFLRHRDADDALDPRVAGLADGDAVPFVAFVEALVDTDVVLSAAARGRLRILLDGKELFDDETEAKDPRKKRSDVATFSLARGMHRLTFVVERRGAWGVSIGLGDGKNVFAPSLRVRADDGVVPDAFVVSGRATRTGGGALRAREVELLVGDETRRATTARDGGFYFGDVPDGPHVLRLAPVEGDDASAVQRVVTVDRAHATGMSLVLPDTRPPVVTLEGVADGARVGKRLVFTAVVRDDGRVRGAVVEVGGNRLTVATGRSPFAFELDVAALPRGSQTLEVIALDAADNEGRSKPITIQLVDDDKGPRIKLKGLRKNATVKKPAEVTATVTDPIGVAGVRFEIDGAALAPASDQPHVVTVDPASLEAGRHTLEVIATDTDGNETRESVPFRTK